MKIVYVAHPYTGAEKENVEHVRTIIQNLHHEHPENWYTSPLGEFPSDMPYDVVMEHCFARLRKCDGVIFCNGWHNSSGCKEEYRFAKENMIPILKE